MNADELTKEQVNEMSDAEVVFWCTQFAEQERAVQMRQHMLDQIEIRDAEDGPRVLQITDSGPPIHVDSTVVE
jgi:hypothetical protein